MNVGVKRVLDGIGFTEFILPLFRVIIFVFKSRIFGTGEDLLYLSECFQFLKVEITKEIKEQMVML